MALLAPQKTIEFIQKKTLAFLKDNGKENIVISGGGSYQNSLCAALLNSILPGKVVCHPNSIPEVHQLDLLKVLLELADENKGVIASSLTKEKIFFGLFKKYGYHNVDFFPFGDLYWSEVDELASFVQARPSVVASDELINEPTTPSQLEWMVREEERAKIFSCGGDPAKHQAWFGYSQQQKEMVARYWEIYKQNLHKVNYKPVCLIREVVGLVR